jgi:hypothetical protein
LLVLKPTNHVKLKRHESPLPVYFQGQMSSDFLQDLICTCKGKAVCSSGCVLMYWDITPPVLSTGNRTSLKPQLLCMLQLRKNSEHTRLTN